MVKHLTYIFCLVLTFFMALNSSAQNLSVAKFYAVETDVTANLQGTMVLDQNGEKCALIKVQTTQTGFIFDVGVLGVQDVRQQAGEVWVYVPHGIKRITVQHPTLGILRDYEVPCRIESARTYIMELITGEVQTIIKKAITSQYVTFKVTPSKGSIEINNQLIDIVDGGASVRLPFGSYDYRIQAAGYFPQVGKITVNDPKEKHLVVVDLEPASSTITLKVDDDAEAEIWVNDEKKGTGTFTGTLLYGTYLMECRQQGYRTSQKEITLDKTNAGKTIVLPAPTPIYGSADINSTPIEAAIYIDEKHIGTTPMFIPELLIGNHNIKISKSGYRDHIETISIAEGETLTKNTTLEKATAGNAANASKAQSADPDTRQRVRNANDQTFTVNGVTFTMVSVDGGTFTMGATSEQGNDAENDERPAHSVTLSDYYIGQTEVTHELWRAVMNDSPSHYTDENSPVNDISWDDCQAFIRKLNKLTNKKFRLPTEAEWEYAARGGNQSKNYKYSGGSNINEVAWYKDNSGGKIHPVATKKPNELGIYDMSGNVEEWCSDHFGSYVSAAQTNPQGPKAKTDLILRGGAHLSHDKICRVSRRNSNSSDTRYDFIGMRLALSK